MEFKKIIEEEEEIIRRAKEEIEKMEKWRNFFVFYKETRRRFKIGYYEGSVPFSIKLLPSFKEIEKITNNLLR